MKILKTAVQDFINDDCTTMAAALAYYTLLALPPLLLVLISIVGLAFGHDAAQGKIQSEIRDLIGSGAGNQVGTMVQHAADNRSSGIVGAVLGLVTLIFGATTSFAQLQTALNRIWRVKPDPKAGGVWNFLTQRVLSLGMIVAVGFLLLVSLAVSAALSSFGGVVAGWLPEGFSKTLLHGIELAISFLVISALFATVFKVLPDAKLTWRQVGAGALATGALFTVGKFAIGLYLGKTGAASAYGAAGSLVLIVLWIYYSSLIVLLGAEFTRVHAESRGHSVQPKEGAVVVSPLDQAA
jgi:membrane protein